jgi:cytochrome c
MFQRGHALRCALAWTCLLPVLAQAQSVSRGQQLVESRCFACHSLDANRVGPALRGVVGRLAGKAPDSRYSAALAAATHRWDAMTLKVR